jgi:hypothetical protein
VSEQNAYKSRPCNGSGTPPGTWTCDLKPYELSKDGTTTIEALVRVRNVGNGTARDGYLIVEANTDQGRQIEVDCADRWWLEVFCENNARHYSARLPIHPSSVRDVFRVVWRIPGQARFGGMAAPDHDAIVIRFRFFAENQEPQSSELTARLTQLKSGKPELICATLQPA